MRLQKSCFCTWITTSCLCSTQQPKGKVTGFSYLVIYRYFQLPKLGVLPMRGLGLVLSKIRADRLASGQDEMYSMFWSFLQISFLIFSDLDAVVEEGLLFWWHGWIMVKLEAVHLCVWRRVDHSGLGAVMNTVAEVDQETWKTEQEISLSSLKSDYIFRLMT